MFVNETLKTHLETSSTVKLESLVLTEWNLNNPENIFLLGNYRYRPLSSDTQYRNLPVTFDRNDAGNYYTGATDSDVVIDGGYTNSNIPQIFTSKKEKLKMIYSLEDCIKPFRPRSGINKATYFNNKYLQNSGKNIAQRPRYYMPSRYDEFKYWTSYRTEQNLEYGIANKIINGLNYIYDSVPFVIYENPVPANRIIIKMQTNVGDIDLGPFTNGAVSASDPFYGTTNKTTPVRWRVEYLKNNNWTTAISFDEASTRSDNSPIIGTDGYVELQYGLNIPEQYTTTFKFIETLSSETLLPDISITGYAYLIKTNSTDKGIMHIWTGNEYETFVPNYGWSLAGNTIVDTLHFVTDFVSPDSFTDNLTSRTEYRQFQYISGIRIVVETMNKFDSTFDLIEFSPRLIANISDRVIDFNITKVLSDLSTTSLPVGQLLASTGQINIFDDDQSFNENNKNSIISSLLSKNIKFSFYENILDVDDSDYYVPIKTLYSQGFSESQNEAGTLSMNLRDLYFFLESMPAPRLLSTQTSLSYAICTLLDYVGFTNYTFKRLNTDTDPIIPYFFIAPDQNVAEVLNQLAISTQSAIFFDEYNNLVVMSKNYMMAKESERTTDFIISGNSDITVRSNPTTSIENGLLPNIISIASQDKKIYNGGTINYTTRYIQRSYGNIRQASLVDQDKTWIYKPALLWEVSGTEATKTINEVASQQGSYVLGAMPLNSTLSESLPTVVNGVVTNNILDIGENVYWLTRYSGYLYSNGEIIKYDAAQFNITGTGNVWISNNQEYQNYFAALPFNGKIYPTGLLRIYSVPYYEIVNGITKLKNGSVQEHGRGQFGTLITTHSAGISDYWSNNDYVRGCSMNSNYLFTTDIEVILPETTVAAAGINNTLAKQTTRNSIIKNFMSTSYNTETDINSFKSTNTGTIQSSALVMNGPSFKTDETPVNFVSYVYKNLNNAYKSFGTRMRIIGKIENDPNRFQTPVGSTTYYQIPSPTPSQNLNIGGGSGGMAVLLNPETNNGYYFEIIALTENNIESYLQLDENGNSDISISNIVFYKIKKDSTSNTAIPIKLWGGLSKIITDDGRFTGQYRITGEENPTVYDLSVEYEDIGKVRRFYLYINNKLIKVIDDADPLPIYNNMALFVRGSSRVMFENIYALSQNYSQNTTFNVGQTLSNVFGDKQINANDSFRKYAMSGVVQSTYLSGISSQQPSQYNIYFDEFGSIMRECAYFDIRYDRAYPALYAQLSPTFNRIKGYTVSGFQADSYGAEFIIFNATDKALVLDETSGNYLRIQGVTFTQDTTHQYTVDEYFAKKSNLSDPELKGNTLITSPIIEQEKYNQIKLSRMNYGKNEFSIDAPYIQTQDDAEKLMDWIINRIMVQKKSIGVNIFAIPTLQLGDIVTIKYTNEDGVDTISNSNSRYIVYNIEYRRSNNGPDMTIYLSEV